MGLLDVALEIRGWELVSWGAVVSSWSSFEQSSAPCRPSHLVGRTELGVRFPEISRESLAQRHGVTRNAADLAFFRRKLPLSEALGAAYRGTRSRIYLHLFVT